MTDGKPQWQKGMNMKGMHTTLTNMNEALDNMRKVYEVQRKQLEQLKRKVNDSAMGK